MLFFQPVYDVAECWSRMEKVKPIMDVTPQSGLARRSVATLVNGGRKLSGQAVVVVTLVITGAYSFFSWPIRKIRFEWAIDRDINLLTSDAQTALRQRITQFIETKTDLFKNMSTRAKNNYVRLAMAYYARSQAFYGRVSTYWVKYIFDKAQASGKKIVFVARDGEAPYLLAKELLKIQSFRDAYPSLLDESQIVLGYFSRALTLNANNPDKPENRTAFTNYLHELGIADNDRCIFVDVGFLGTIIPPIQQIRGGGDDRSSFEYLISHTRRRADGTLPAEGYLYSLNNEHALKAMPINKAGGNRGNHWLEDTHQGIAQSPNRLVEHNGHTYPDTRIPGQERDYSANPFEYLLRYWSQQAIADSAQRYGQGGPTSLTDVSQARDAFDSLLLRTRDHEVPTLILHRNFSTVLSESIFGGL